MPPSPLTPAACSPSSLPSLSLPKHSSSVSKLGPYRACSLDVVASPNLLTFQQVSSCAQGSACRVPSSLGPHLLTFPLRSLFRSESLRFYQIPGRNSSKKVQLAHPVKVSAHRGQEGVAAQGSSKHGGQGGRDRKRGCGDKPEGKESRTHNTNL